MPPPVTISGRFPALRRLPHIRAVRRSAMAAGRCFALPDGRRYSILVCLLTRISLRVTLLRRSLRRFFKVFVVFLRFFANFIFSSKLSPNSHLSTDVFDSIVFMDMFRLAMIMLFLASDSSLWIEARSLPTSLSFSNSSSFPGISVLR